MSIQMKHPTNIQLKVNPEEPSIYVFQWELHKIAYQFPPWYPEVLAWG